MKPLLLAAVLLVVPLQAQTADPVAGLTEAPAAAMASGDAQHPAIAVLPLRGQAAQAFGNPGDAIYQRVTASFFKTKRFTMIERAQLGAVLGEGKNQNTVAFDDASAVALGRQVGAKIVVIGSYSANISHTSDRLVDKKGNVTMVEAFPADVTVNLRMVSVETGHIQEVVDAKGTANEGNPAASTRVVLEDLSRKMEREVGNRFPAFGYVIKVLDPK
jgi:curli biogenesis system outer membrane secretion channel CsgG